MGDHIALDYEELRAARADIGRAAEDFESADSVSADIASVVGHSGLASKVEDFADSWDISREKLQEGLEFVGSFLTAIIDSFTELDQAQADAVTTTGPVPSPTPGPAPTPPSGS